MRPNEIKGGGLSRRVLWAAIALVPLAGISGCTGKSEPNGFLDPTSVGRFDDKRPLVVPILSHLDVGMEEANGEFQSATEVRPEDLVAHPSDYLISPNDLLSISISDLVGPGVEQVKTTRVTETGKVSLPMIGQVQAAGLSEAELERSIQQAYKNAGLIQNAQVSVTVQEARGRTFSIVGPGVQHAGQYPMLKGDFRLLDALVASGDVMPFSEQVYVIRSSKPRSNAAGAGQTGGGNAGGATTQPSPAEQLAPPANPGAMLEPQPAQPAAPATPAQPAAQPAPTTASAAPAATPAGTAAPATQPSGEGRIVIIDGKPVLIEGGQTTVAATQPSTTGGQATAAAPAAGAAAAAPAPAAPQPMPEAARQGGQPFEFAGPDQEGQRIIRVSLRDLRNGDMRQNIVIHPGDMLFVPGPVVGEYYMEGHVNRPGVYSLNGREITLTQAIASAGMFDQIAIPRRTEIRRRLGPDREVVIGVDLDSVFAGTQPNVYLRPNDEINVGTNLWAPFLAAVRGGFRMTYGFGFLYDRNFASRANNAGLGGSSSGH